jgi:hypothetical protein
MSYQEIAELAALRKTHESVRGLDSWDPDIVRRSSCYDAWLSQSISGEAEQWSAFDESVYLTGWLQGLISVWTSIQEQL